MFESVYAVGLHLVLVRLGKAKVKLCHFVAQFAGVDGALSHKRRFDLCVVEVKTLNL